MVVRRGCRAGRKQLLRTHRNFFVGFLRAEPLLLRAPSALDPNAGARIAALRILQPFSRARPLPALI